MKRDVFVCAWVAWKVLQSLTVPNANPTLTSNQINQQQQNITYWSPKSSNGGSKRTRLAATLKHTHTHSQQKHHTISHTVIQQQSNNCTSKLTFQPGNNNKFLQCNISAACPLARCTVHWFWTHNDLKCTMKLERHSVKHIPPILTKQLPKWMDTNQITHLFNTREARLLRQRNCKPHVTIS